MEGHAHFQYHMSSVIAHPIIYGGRSLITYSSMYIPYRGKKFLRKNFRTWRWPSIFISRSLWISTFC